MTAYLRYGRHEIECNHRTLTNGDSVQCDNVAGFLAESYSIDSALANIESWGWGIVEPIVPDGGIHLCPEHAEDSPIPDVAIPSGTHFTSCGYLDGRVCTCVCTSARIEADKVRETEKRSSVSDSSRVEIDASETDDQCSRCHHRYRNHVPGCGPCTIPSCECASYRDTESLVPSTTLTVDASRDLATIRLRTATGHLYDINVGWITDRLIPDHNEGPPGSATVTLVPTWEGIPIPDGLVDTHALDWWKRGVTDANNATLNGEPK